MSASTTFSRCVHALGLDQPGNIRLATHKQARLLRLREALEQSRSIHVREAAELLAVSEMTIRRDIRDNADLFDYLGGYIVLSGNSYGRTPYDLSSAAGRNTDEKRRACMHCLPLIEPEDTVFVDCGTTLVHLVELLPPELSITLVCFAFNTADRAIRKPNVRLVMIGGEYQAATASFSGLNAESMFADLAINTGFFSAAGVDPTIGVTCTTFPEAVQKKAALAKSRFRVLVVDSTKFDKISRACFARLDEFDLVLTENGPLARSS